MLQKQKEIILELLKSAKVGRNKYWCPYKDFLDPRDSFTDFSCENLEGKKGYIDLIENLLMADGAAKVFVEVYGFEEDGNEQFIYADTLIIFSRLSLVEVKQIFNGANDIFPSDIGEVIDLEQNFIIGNNGVLIPAANTLNVGYSVYYCWWD